MKIGKTGLFYAALAALVLLIAGCSSASEPSGDHTSPPADNSEKRYLDISLDGKVVWKNGSKGTVPVPDLKVTMISAEGTRIDSARTNSNGRFLIERRNVPVGYYWEKHIYVEISDDREMDAIEEKKRYETLRVLKQIDAAPNNHAFLTMDEIVVKRVEDPAAANNSQLCSTK